VSGDMLAQAVFYSLFYAFPKSRTKFTDHVKKKLLMKFSKMLTGVTLSNSATFIDKWNLDLGAGNIFKMYPNQFYAGLFLVKINFIL
jgi:hypothetical protein